MHGRVHAWHEGGMHGRGLCGRVVGGHAWQGMCMAEGACMAGGHAWQGVRMAGEMATAADGTHPTGMHSC